MRTRCLPQDDSGCGWIAKGSGSVSGLPGGTRGSSSRGWSSGIPGAGSWACPLSGAHFFGALDTDLFAAAGYKRVGVAMGTISGTLLVDLALEVMEHEFPGEAT